MCFCNLNWSSQIFPGTVDKTRQKNVMEHLPFKLEKYLTGGGGGAFRSAKEVMERNCEAVYIF